MQRRAFSLSAAATALLPSLHGAAAAPHTVGIIGHTGAGGYGHGLDTMWLSLPECRIVAVADADDTGRAAALGKLKLSTGYADYRQMLQEQRPALVAIGPRYVQEHRDMLLAAISAGVQGIYLEKPFCRTLAEADEIISAANQRGVQVAVAHRNRYHPVLPVVRQLLADGAIGRVLEYRARGKEDARGGCQDMWVLGSHLFNLLHYLAGQPLAVSASIMHQGKPALPADLREGAEGVGPLLGSEVHARFEMESGVPAYFDSIQGAGVKTAGFGLQIIGTEGIIDWRADEEPAAQIHLGSPYRPTAEPRSWQPISTAGVGKPEPLPALHQQVMGGSIPARDLLSAIAEKRQPLCSAKDARIGMEMIFGVMASHRAGSARVQLPLQQRGHPLEGWH
jgi:predicted dehydrogenase